MNAAIVTRNIFTRILPSRARVAGLPAVVRWLLRGGAAFGAVVCLYLLAAVVGAVVPGPRAELGPRTDLFGLEAGAPADVEIRLISGPIHYDLMLPADAATRRAFGFASGVPVDHPGAAWVVVGWGAEQFYTTIGGYRDLRFSAVWRGITGDRAVLRLDVAGPVPEDVGRVLRLTRGQYDRLVADITAEAGAPLDVPGFTQTDQFYQAKGPFHIVRPCNQWVGERLRAAGLRFGVWTPTPFAVTLSHWWHQM